MHFLCSRFCLLCGRLESDGLCLLGNPVDDAAHFSSNLETICATTWNSHKLKYHNSRVFVS